MRPIMLLVRWIANLMSIHENADVQGFDKRHPCHAVHSYGGDSCDFVFERASM
jgi:hypothetical protein